MIRNVVIHVSNEQPLLADLFSVPSPADVGLVCTNVRMIDGKKPIFIDHADSTFFFPNLHIRFLEIPAAEMARHLAAGGAAPGAVGLAARGGATDEAATIDPDGRMPIPLGAANGATGSGEVELEAEPVPDPEAELVIDEDFLQRIRDI